MGNKIDDKLIMTMAILEKAMQQLDSVIVDDDSQRIKHWKNNIYTVNEEIHDYILENK